MRILLDTHSLVWYLEGDSRLSNDARSIIDDEKQEIFASHVNFYEIAIKMKIDKFPTKKTLTDFIEGTKESAIKILAISELHLIDYWRVPLIKNHRDPFDRLLIATALHEQLDIITADEKFNYYKDYVRTVW